MLEDRALLAAITVTTFTDVVDGGDGLTSLREAITTANSNAEADMITLPAGTYTVAIAGANENSNATGDFDIAADGGNTLTIQGAGQSSTIIDGADLDRLFDVKTSATLNLNGVTVTNGTVSGLGGGISNVGILNLTDAAVTNNIANGSGGGIHNSGTVSMLRTTVSGNQAVGTFQISGAINNAGGNVRIDSSTLSGNTAQHQGGAMRTVNGSMTIINSTISGNTASVGGGGAIDTFGGTGTDSTTLINTTLVGNFGGGIRATNPVTLVNSIVAGNRNVADTANDDISGTLAGSTNSLIGDSGTAGGVTNGTNGNIVGNAGSGTITLSTVLNTTLADNGGPTFTHAIVAGGPAVDAGDPASLPVDTSDLDGDGNTTEAVPFDQRGANNPRQVGTVDIGAVESFTTRFTFVETLTDGGNDSASNLLDKLNKPFDSAVSPDGKFVFVAVGNSDTTLNVFSRNAATGALTLASTVSSGGLDAAGATLPTFKPNSVAVSPDGAHVYVVAFEANSLLAFSLNSTTGGLTHLQTLVDGDGSNNGLNSVNEVIVSHDGKNVYAGSGNELGVYIRNTTTGLLTFQQNFNQSGQYGSLVESPDGKNLYSSIQNGGTLKVFSRNATNGNLSNIQSISDGGTDVAGNPVTKLGSSHDLDITPDGKFLYVAGRGDNSIVVFSRRESDGKLTLVEELTDGGTDSQGNTVEASGVGALAVSPDGERLASLETSSGTQTLSIWDINRTTGQITVSEQLTRNGTDALGTTITGLNGNLFSLQGRLVVFSPDSAHVYASGGSDKTVTTFQRIALGTPLDFGDAPYATTFVDNGARHTATGLTLGALRDKEVDGIPSANANSDDVVASDDDDGVTFSSAQVGQQNATVTVNVQGAAGKLDAWIDFNGDGSFFGLGEQIADNLSVSTGDNTVTFDVPADALDGNVITRFRLSTAGGLAPTGLASDGEVEDHIITLTASPGSGTFADSGQSLSSVGGEKKNTGTYLADFDNDGDVDALFIRQDADSAIFFNDGSGTFGTENLITTGTALRDGEIGDFDADGDMDFIHGGSGAVFLNNDGALGTFTAATGSQTRSSGFGGIAVGDVNGDGVLDVIIANSSTTVHSNNGSAAFTQTRSIATSGATGAALGDLDNDGDLDLFVASNSTSVVYRNDGTGNFTEITQSPVLTTTNGNSVALADLDGDGDLDAYVSADNQSDRVFKNDGNGNFTQHATADGGRGLKVRLGDIDGDGDFDALVFRYASSSVILVNDGSANFSSSTISTGGSAQGQGDLGDVNGDGSLDAVAGLRQQANKVFFNAVPLDFGDAPAPYPTTLSEDGARHTPTGPTLGTGRDSETDATRDANATGDDLNDSDDEDGVTFGTITVGQQNATVTVNVQGAAGKLDAWIDFNGDGSFNGYNERIFHNVSVATGNNNLTFDVPAETVRSGDTFARFRLSTAGGLSPSGLAADGEVEDHKVTLSQVEGDGIFSDSGQALGSGLTYGVAIGDVNGDGFVDVFAANHSGDNILWINNGSGVFTDSGQTAIELNGQISLEADFADLDGDGDLDLVVFQAGSNLTSFENDGSGGFTALDSVSVGGAGNTYGGRLADVDGDGDIDAIAGSNGQKVLFNDGTGNFTAGPAFGVTNPAYSIGVGDIDGDGDVDVVFPRGGAPTRIFLNDGSGGFTDSGVDIGASFNGKKAELGDIDGDGDLDLLVGNSNNATEVLINQGGTQGGTEGVFVAGTNFGTSTRGVRMADLDGDGDLDAFTTADSAADKVWFNDGIGGFTDSGISLGNFQGRDVRLADFNGDGSPDAFVGNTQSQANRVYFNPVFDFGDAPAPYPTTLVENGARHLPAGPTLGTNRDIEADATRNATATGDDTTGTPDDEDGVTFGTITVGAQNATVTVNASAVAKLDAWIDFDGDGSFNGANEQIFDTVTLASGNNNLTFDVPAFIRSGTTYARFRLSTAGGLGPGGIASDGEVEDYQVTIAAPGGFANFVDSGQSLGSDRTVQTVLADLDNDGDLDALSVNFTNTKIYTNASGTFTDSGQTLVGSQFQFSVPAVGDIDADGDLDVYIGDRFYTNNGSGVFSAGQVISGLGTVAGSSLGDIDADGDLDLFVARNGSDMVFTNNGSGTFTNTGQSLGSQNSLVLARLADIDGDGDLDAVGRGVYTNDGAGTFTASSIPFGSNTRAVALGDFDGDGDQDAVVGDKAAPTRIYTNNGSGTFTSGAALGSNIRSYGVAVADVDGDGDLDILSGFTNGGQYDQVFLNNGSGAFTDSGQALNGFGTGGVTFGDIDGDGDLDVFVSSQPSSGNENKVYFNEQASDTEVTLDGSSNLVITDTGGGTSNDTLTVSASATLITINDPGNIIKTTIAGATGSFTNTVLIPLTSFTGDVQVVSLAGNDTINVQGLNLGGTRGLSIDAGDGTDTVNFQTSTTTLTNANLTVTAETINLNTTALATGTGNQVFNGAVLLQTDTALTAGDVTFNGTVNSNGTPVNLTGTAFFAMDESSGVLVDSAGVAQNLTAPAGVTYSQTGLNSGTGIDFTNATSGAKSTDAAFDITSDASFTFEGFFKADDVTDTGINGYLGGTYGNSALDGWAVFMRNNGRIGFIISGAVDYQTTGAEPTYDDGQAHSFAFIWDHDGGTTSGGKATLYVDGTLQRTEDNITSVPSNADFAIGRRDAAGGNAFPGVLDDFRFTNNVLPVADFVSGEFASANLAANLSGGKTYAYTTLLPGDGAGNYLDDPHTQSLGVFSTGELTDGAVHPDGASVAGANTALTAFQANPAPAPASEIIFDLGSVVSVSDVTLGTYRTIQFSNSTPDDVSISFSSTGTNAGDFGSTVSATFPIVANEVHVDLPAVSVPNTPARYVKLNFDGDTADGPTILKYGSSEKICNIGSEVQSADQTWIVGHAF
jgi:6-phosphogluconolactonase (cycloisomerase 2 family)